MPVDGQFTPINSDDLSEGYTHTTTEDGGGSNTVTFNEDFDVIGEAFNDGEGNTFSQTTVDNEMALIR